MNIQTPTPHDMLLDYIDSLSANEAMEFDDKSQALSTFINGLSDTDLKALLGEAGFIPEKYPHDSSEEKVYAKAMDILIAASLNRVGYEATVSVERSNSADVYAKCPTGDLHTIVLDGKAFRLSRTALNPKDYKIQALDTWRKGADYACLVGPLASFPQEDSRLFKDAVEYNVTLLTFSHLQFMLEHGLPADNALVPLWTVSKEIEQTLGKTPNAEQYWLQSDRVFCMALRVDIAMWKDARRRYFNSMLKAADKQIEYFEREIDKIRSFSREELINLLLNALKLKGKLNQIKSKKRKTIALLEKVEQAESRPNGELWQSQES